MYVCIFYLCAVFLLFSLPDFHVSLSAERLPTISSLCPNCCVSKFWHTSWSWGCWAVQCGLFPPPPPTIYTFSMPGVCQVCSPSPKANSSTSPQLTAFVWHPKTAFSIFWSDLLQRWSQRSEFLPRTPRDRHRWGTWITVKNSPPDSALRISQLAAMKARSQTAHLLRI